MEGTTMLETAGGLCIVMIAVFVMFFTVSFLIFGMGFVWYIQRETGESYEESFYIAMDETKYAFWCKLSDVVEKVRSF